MPVKRKDVSSSKTGSGNITTALSSIGAIYNQAKQAARSFSGEKLPEGKYEFRLSGIKLKESIKDNKATIRMVRTFTVLSGENEGMSQGDMFNLSNEHGLSFALQFIELMGYPIPDSPEEIPDIVEELQKEAPACYGEVKHSGDFVNIRVLELIEEDEELDEDDMFDELIELTRRELKKILEEEDIDFKVTKRTTEEDIVNAIIDARFED